MTETRSSTDARQGRDAYERLLQAIRSGVYKPGDRMVETELAKQLGTSRTPIREAMRQLESDGLVAHQPRIGATVRSLDYSEITELYEMRAVLEGTSARFAARAASDVELAELHAVNAEMENAGSVEALYEANRQFHRVILNAARNRYLVKSVEAVQKTLFILGPSTMEETDRATRAVAEHRAILDAFDARDQDAAEQAMRAHIEAAHRARLRQLRLRSAA